MTEETTWHVQVEAGDVKVWTLDQLDAAFKAGLIDESTFVLEDGSTEWMQLGTLLGGDDEEPEAPAPMVAAPAPVPVMAAAPVIAAPVIQHVAPMSYAPMSTAPVAADLDFDEPEPFRRSKKGPVLIGAGVALVAAAVAAFAFTRGGSPAVAEPPVQAALAVAPPPAPAPPPPAADKPADTSHQLSDEQRKRLADLDKAHADKMDAQQKARAAAAPHRSGHKSGKSGSPFHNGGDKYNPLNAKL